ncbi:MAG: hypothetical protein LBK23_02915 [Oscillospiraceae bacterium]|jgi:hypothetical protein|nr:hypothetical protein [Oscillospiraceae bacterium]
MTAAQMRANSAIEAQQREHGEYSTPWMVGEQLKDICAREPAAAELIAQDLENPEMSLEKAERKIKAWADKHKKSGAGGVGVPPVIAEGILREFYGLAARDAGTAGDRGRSPLQGNVDLDLTDFL